MTTSPVLRAYVECALWTSTHFESEEDSGTPMDDLYGIEDVAPDALTSMREDVDAFVAANAGDLLGLSDEAIGHDFWLTRNGHGAGFWDRGLGARGQRLKDAARAYGESDLYVGDDGLVHVS